MAAKSSFSPFAAIAVVAALLVIPLHLPAARLAAQLPDDGAGSFGRLLGQVVDAETGRPLPGAQVVLEDRSRGVVAGIEGRFQMDRVPVGSISIEVLLIGYAPRTVTDIDVSAEGITVVDVVMERQAIQLEGVTVSAAADRGSAVSLISEQRQAEAVVNAISAEQIARSPDGDAAAAVRRVSGVTVQDGKYVFVRGLGERYTTSSLNGARIPSPEPERKMVPLDLFPSGLLQAITTSKTFTPDQPGDFSGGNVDIRTPSFPSRTTIGFSMSTGYGVGTTGQAIYRAPTVGGEWRAAATAAREIPDEAANFPGTAARGPQVNAVVNSFRNAWSVAEESGRLPISLGTSIGGSTPLLGQTIGYIGSLTWSNSESARLDEERSLVGTGGVPRDHYVGSSGTASVQMGGLLNLAALIGTHSQLHLGNTYNRSADNSARREVGLNENNAATVRVDRLTYVERVVRSHQLRGEHQIGTRNRFEWALSTAGVTRMEPDRSEFVMWMDPEVPVWFNDFQGAVRSFGSLDESSNEASVRYEFTFGGDLGSLHRIRLGATRRTTEREAQSLGYRIQTFEWAPTDPRWQLTPEEFFDGRNAGPDDAVFLLSRLAAGGNYDAEDELTAAFLMAEVKLHDRLRLLGGARIERYDFTVYSENQLGQEFTSERIDTDIMPALNATIAVTENQQLRLAASRTLARPEYRELAPIVYREVLGGEQVRGNDELERTRIENADVRWEWYPGPGEVISVGVFAKRFDKPVEERYLATSGTDTRTFVNAESAVNRGVEFEVVTELGRIGERFEPFSIFSNLTLIRSSVNTGIETDPDRAMVGQAPWVVNSGITWSPIRSDWSGTLLHNAVGPRIVNARASGSTTADVVEEPRHVLDLSIRFPLRGGTSAKLDLKNLLDAPVEVRQGPVVRSTYREGRSLSVGVSWRW